MPSNNTDRAKIPCDKLSNTLCDGGSALRWTHPREAMGVLCVLQLLLESFVHLLRCFACKWFIKLSVPPPSASCWVQRRHCTHFTSLPLTFITVGGSKNSQMGLVCFLYAMALFWLSAALLARLLFFTHASRLAALFPDADTKMGLGTRFKKPCDQELNPDMY